MSCKVKLSGFIFQYLDCQELESEADSKKWPYIRPEPDAIGIQYIPNTEMGGVLTVVCCVAYNSHAQWYTSHEQFLKSVGLGLGLVFIFVHLFSFSILCVF